MEQKLLGRPLDKEDSIYGAFLDSDRMKEVQALETVFHSHNFLFFTALNNFFVNLDSYAFDS